MVDSSLSMHKAQSSVLVLDKLGVAVHACNPRALKTERQEDQKLKSGSGTE